MIRPRCLVAKSCPVRAIPNPPSFRPPGRDPATARPRRERLCCVPRTFGLRWDASLCWHERALRGHASTCPNRQGLPSWRKKSVTPPAVSRPAQPLLQRFRRVVFAPELLAMIRGPDISFSPLGSWHGLAQPAAADPVVCVELVSDRGRARTSGQLSYCLDPSCSGTGAARRSSARGQIWTSSAGVLPVMSAVGHVSRARHMDLSAAPDGRHARRSSGTSERDLFRIFP